MHQARALDQCLAEGVRQTGGNYIRITRKKPSNALPNGGCAANAALYITSSTGQGRRVCDICGGDLFRREDDNEETARKRLEVHMSRPTQSPIITLKMGDCTALMECVP